MAVVPKWSGVLASLLLSAVTLGTFGVLQGYGPESAIRRFHDAVQRGDVHEVQATVLEPMSPQDAANVLRFRDAVARDDARELLAAIRGQAARSNVDVLLRRTIVMLGSGATYRIARVERRPGQVRAALVYRLPTNVRIVMVWVVEPDAEGVWRIDASKTMGILRDAMGL